MYILYRILYVRYMFVSVNKQCHVSFKCRSTLNPIHPFLGVKPFECLTCGVAWADARSLKRHVRTHTGERPYKCDLPACNRAFPQLSNLKRHQKNHATEMEKARQNPFQCSVCTGLFSSERELREHDLVCLV